MIRILHTADWHLGHRLYNQDRTPEHRAALRWLLEVITEEQVDVLIVAGDVFDVSNPSNQARELYYDFLTSLVRSPCTAAVIVGGNHDSPSMLDAPRGLMRALQLHVVGAARDEANERLIELEVGEQKLLVAAIPYLRERDLRMASFGESADDRLAALRAGIATYFRETGEAALHNRKHPRWPIVATGHLYAGGAEDDPEKTSYIYQADEQNIRASEFPACFDYVALGHIHRAQHVGGLEHVRYAGSLIPLTFVEGQRARSVRLVELGAGGEKVNSRKLEVPPSRPLHRLHGTLAEVKTRLREALDSHSGDLTGWVEVKVLTDRPLPNLYESLREIILNHAGERNRLPSLEILRISTERIHPIAGGSQPAEHRQLDEVRPEEVFAELCTTRGYDEEAASRLMDDFRMLRNWMEERESV